MSYQHLIGLEFRYGTQDCYGLLRRFYRDQFGIEIPNVARPTRFWEEGIDLYGMYYYELGFRPLDCHPSEYKFGDVALMAIQSITPNHVGIFVENGKILHHMVGRRSETTRFGGIYRNNTLNVYRHKDVRHDQQEGEIHFMDIVSERMRSRIHGLIERPVETG